MSPQIAFIRGCIVTLVAFVWLFSTVYFQMFPQIACPRRGIVSLVAFVWFFFFIISVFLGKIYIDPTFTTCSHHPKDLDPSPPIGDCRLLFTVNFKQRKLYFQVRRDRKWKLETLLNSACFVLFCFISLVFFKSRTEYGNQSDWQCAHKLTFTFLKKCFVLDFCLLSKDPSRDCLMAPNQSDLTSIAKQCIGLTSEGLFHNIQRIQL